MANASNSGASDKPSREDRLAAKLRENLRRRKAQARAASGSGNDRPPSPEPSHQQENADKSRRPATALPKEPSKS